jgi:hypothetical protein
MIFYKRNLTDFEKWSDNRWIGNRRERAYVVGAKDVLVYV